ncbi:MAG: MFS transporter, partial [Clostridia bacterium]|nr:MFS transporter [Clostridia bacterium]
LLRLPREEGAPARGKGGLLAEWLAGFRLVFRSRMLRRVLLATVVANFALAPTDLLLTAWVKGPLGGSGSLLGVIYAGFFAGMVAGGLLLGRLSARWSTRSLIAAGVTFAGLAFAAVGAWPNAAWDVAATVATGLAASLATGASTAWFLGTVPQGMLGRTIGIAGALNTAMVPLGVAVAGALMIALPLPLLWLVLGALTLAAGLTLAAPVEDDLARAMAGEAGPAGP